MIGLCIAFEKQNNYGTQLQSYATIEAVKNLGYDCEIIIYHRKGGIIENLCQIKRLFHDEAIKGYISSKKRAKLVKKDTEFGNGYRLRREYVKAFKEKYFFPFSKTYTGYKELCKGSRNYSTVLVGSDQVWLPSGYASKFYNLMFVPDDIPKISYASSFGVSSISRYHQKEAKVFLDRIDYISVREIKGKELVETYSNNQAKVAVDPTMLIDSCIWHNMCVPIKETGYIFCYFLGKRREGREQAQKLKECTGLKIVVLKHLDEYIPEDDKFGDEWPYDVGPEKFISYIKNATYVLTDSFHGTVFSILFKKKFMTFYRNEATEKLSKNSRIDSLLGQLNLMQRLYKKGNILQLVSADINYDEVHEILNKLRKDSIDYLSNSLKACENNDKNKR